MSNNPPAPELIEAYKLIKAGQKSQAGQMLKTYLAQSKDDPQAWWLMSHAVTKPDTVRRCLETVLKLDPNHDKARARLAALSGAPPPADDPFAPPAQRVKTAPPAPTPVPASRRYDQFPSDEMVLAGLTMPAPAPVAVDDPFAPEPVTHDDPFAPSANTATATPVDDPFASAPAAAEPAGSFEDFLASDQTTDPFAAPHVDDPFAPSAHTAAPSGSYDPFAAENVFDPTAAARLGTQSSTQAAGTGNQPEWGPGLAFVPDASVEIGGSSEGVGGTILNADDLRVERRRRGGTNPLVIFGGFVAFAIVIALVFAVMSMIGPRENVPSMTTMDIPAFSIDYPKGWDQRCEAEQRGYPVCGMANHKIYNEVDYFAGTDIDLGEMFGDLIGFGFTGQNLPDEAVSIIAMDVPESSYAYDDASWAKTLYEWDFGDKPTYNKKTMQIDGYDAYYYEFKSQNNYFTWAAWDLYIRHGATTFWLRVDFSGDGKKAIPQKMVNKMIESIDLK